MFDIFNERLQNFNILIHLYRPKTWSSSLLSHFLRSLRCHLVFLLCLSAVILFNLWIEPWKHKYTDWSISWYTGKVNHYTLPKYLVVIYGSRNEFGGINAVGFAICRHYSSPLYDLLCFFLFDHCVFKAHCAS